MERPGPGGYDDGNTFGKGGIMYSIRNKTPEKRGNDHPGPGTYD